MVSAVESAEVCKIMSKNLYIATMEPRSGKSVISLGIMEFVSRRLHNVGFFRPIIPDVTCDNNIQLILKRYALDLSYEETHAFKHQEAQDLVADGKYDTLLKAILGKYKALESKCNFILCEGTDYSGVSSAFEFEINADIANNLGCPILVVVNGRRKSGNEIEDAIGVARESFEDQGCTILATIVNRVDPQDIDSATESLKPGRPVESLRYTIPEDPLLGKPTVGDIAASLKSEIIQSSPQESNREVLDFKVAAMNLPHFLERIQDGDLIITPADRADIILGCLSSSVSDTYPNISGLLLTGGMTPDRQIRRLIEGFKDKSPLTVFSVNTDTYHTAMDASAVRAALTPENDRKIASALGLFETHVDMSELKKRLNLLRSKRVTPIMFEYELIERAKANQQHIVLPEGEDERILRAAEILLRRKVADLTLLGYPDRIHQNIGALGLNLDNIRIIDPSQSDLRERYAAVYHDLRKHKGISEQMAMDTMADVSYFGTMMVHCGDAGGMVSGAIHTTGETIRPALQIIRTRPGVSIVSSVFLMCLADRVLVYGDCAVNPDPNAMQLADIALSSAETAAVYGIEPRVAMCSYSTGESGKGSEVDKVRKATRIARAKRPDLKIEGPIQYDAAVDAGVAKTKLPDSEVAGRATVFIFPDLNTGNNLYKAVQRSAGAVAVGPVLQGLNKPVNDLSRGCTVTDIVNTVAITAIQAQNVKISGI
jgi:phosphate acetyltransferase